MTAQHPRPCGGCTVNGLAKSKNHMRHAETGKSVDASPSRTEGGYSPKTGDFYIRVDFDKQRSDGSHHDRYEASRLENSGLIPNKVRPVTGHLWNSKTGKLPLHRVFHTD